MHLKGDLHSIGLLCTCALYVFVLYFGRFEENVNITPFKGEKGASHLDRKLPRGIGKCPKVEFLRSDEWLAP